MYVPIFKHRTAETNIIRDYFGKTNLSSDLIPLVEVAEEKYSSVPEMHNGIAKKETYINENGRKCHRQKRITLDVIPQKLSRNAKNKKIMIDYLRLSPRQYDGIKTELMSFCTKLDLDYDFYKTKVLNLLNYPNIIPVISMKPGTRHSSAHILDLINELGHNIKCLRVHVDVLEETFNILNELDHSDFLIIDFKHSDDFISYDFNIIRNICKAKIILSYANRKGYQNPDYPNLEYTNLISNQHIIISGNNKLDGYSDYAGLKDDYGASKGGNGTGSALALFFDAKKLQYYCYKNNDTSLGMKGYKYIAETIFNSSFYLSHSDCDSFNEVRKILSEGKYGNWSSWIKVTIISTLYQTSKLLKKEV